MCEIRIESPALMSVCLKELMNYLFNKCLNRYEHIFEDLYILYEQQVPDTV